MHKATQQIAQFSVQAAEQLLQGGSWKAKRHSQGGSPAHAAPAAPAEDRPSPLPETQAVTSGQMSDALANIEDLAAIYPDSQAQPAAPEQGTAPGSGPAEPQVGCCTTCALGVWGRCPPSKASQRCSSFWKSAQKQVLNAELQEHGYHSVQGLGQTPKSWASVYTTAQ